MIKRMIILIIMGLTLSSCQLFTEAIKDNMYRVELARERKELSKKDGPGAIMTDEYKEGVERATQDIMKRPINKKVQFEGATFIIPENTRLNSKHGNLVDEKTGYGIFISFSINPHCISKKVNNREYGFFFDKHDVNINKIAKEIMRVNGFKDTCK